MALHVNSNLALKAVTDDARRADAESKLDPRAQLAAQFIPAGARVLDLGQGGGETLRDLMPFGATYECADSLTHGQGSLIHDLTGAEFTTRAAAESDVVMMLGVAGAMNDLDGVFAQLAARQQDVVISYATADLAELVNVFSGHGFRIECTAPVNEREMMMRLTPSRRVAPVASSNIAVVSDSDGSSFGARLGAQMINTVLPGAASIHHMTFRNVHEARGEYDLVIVGVGNAMFQPLIGDDIIRILARAKSAIGIFGTAYRELIPRPMIERVIDRLDVWYAPYADDVALYGQGRSNAVHLGDWLIEQFPLAHSHLDEPLQIGASIGGEIPLDRTIQLIQRHRQVYSARLHPLLCALTSAEYAAYAEEADQMPGIVSGTFRSMLIDIFGRSYPERQFFMVDRDAVARYKARVHANVADMRTRIAAMLRNVAVA